jgi:hypothetical protein
MANNVKIPATGSGDATPSVATEQVGGNHYQLIEVAPCGTPGLIGLLKTKFRDLGSIAVLKGSSGLLHALWVINNQGSVTAFIQLFDLASGSVVLGSTTPDLEVVVFQLSQVIVPLPVCGVPFGNAISIASTTTEKGATPSSAGVQAFALYI